MWSSLFTKQALLAILLICPFASNPRAEGNISDASIDIEIRYTIVSTFMPNMAFSVYNSDLITPRNKIHAIAHVPNCTDLSQVWKLEMVGDGTGDIAMRSALGIGSEQWAFSLNYCGPESDYFPCIHRSFSTDAYWRLQPVYDSFRFLSRRPDYFRGIKYSGVNNGVGVNLVMSLPSEGVEQSQYWGLRICPT